jgi:hypothetical protein
LAARNVLVDEIYRCKVSDFGLSRLTGTQEGGDDGVYISKNDQGPGLFIFCIYFFINLFFRGCVLVKWMAAESLDKKIFSSKSDGEYLCLVLCYFFCCFFFFFYVLDFFFMFSLVMGNHLC